MMNDSQICLNKDKSIGSVVYVVEGEKTEFSLLKRIFTKILDYDYIDAKKEKDIVQRYRSKDNRHSKVCVIQSQSSNIGSLQTQYDYLDDIYEQLATQYHIDIENSSIYFLFDRDRQSNKNPGIIKDLIKSLKSSMDNDDNMNGILLLSYPCVEAFIISCFEEKCQMEFGQSHQLKTYIGEKSYNINQLDENSLKAATCDMLNRMRDFLQFDLRREDIDDFSHINLKLFGEEEKYFKHNQTYTILSLICISLLDLGIMTFKDN